MTLSNASVCGICLPNLQLSALLLADGCEVESISRLGSNPIVPLSFCKSLFWQEIFVKYLAFNYGRSVILAQSIYSRLRNDGLRLLYNGKAVSQTIKPGRQFFCYGTGVGSPLPIIQPTT